MTVHFSALTRRGREMRGSSVLPVPELVQLLESQGFTDVLTVKRPTTTGVRKPA